MKALTFKSSKVIDSGKPEEGSYMKDLLCRKKATQAVILQIKKDIVIQTVSDIVKENVVVRDFGFFEGFSSSKPSGIQSSLNQKENVIQAVSELCNSGYLNGPHKGMKKTNRHDAFSEMYKKPRATKQAYGVNSIFRGTESVQDNKKNKEINNIYYYLVKNRLKIKSENSNSNSYGSIFNHNKSGANQVKL